MTAKFGSLIGCVNLVDKYYLLPDCLNPCITQNIVCTFMNNLLLIKQTSHKNKLKINDSSKEVLLKLKKT